MTRTIEEVLIERNKPGRSKVRMPPSAYQQGYNPVRYRYVEDYSDGKLYISKTQNVDEAIRAIRSIENPRGKNMHYVGTIPNVVALEWAKQCGAPLYSKEWQAYAVQRLRSPEYKYLRPL